MTDGMLQSRGGKLLAVGGKLAADCCCENPCSEWTNPPANNPVAVVSITPAQPSYDCYRLFNGTFGGTTFLGFTNYSEYCQWVWRYSDSSAGYVYVYLLYGKAAGCWCAALGWMGWTDWQGYGNSYPPVCLADVLNINSLEYHAAELPEGSINIINGKLSGSFNLAGGGGNWSCRGFWPIFFSAAVTISQD
ncbi:MAG: hypothetical protein HZA50_04420 [Planctomycetes bacterium]|nr:hypothetical protein [Planctomycetota bacterium]